MRGTWSPTDGASEHPIRPGADGSCRVDFYRFEAGRIVEEWIALGNACGRDDLLERLLARLRNSGD